MAICGEIPLLEGSISVDGSISYASQIPWIFSGTVQQNILFGQPYNAEWYYKVVNACALVEVSKLRCMLIIYILAQVPSVARVLNGLPVDDVYPILLLSFSIPLSL